MTWHVIKISFYLPRLGSAVAAVPGLFYLKGSVQLRAGRGTAQSLGLKRVRGWCLGVPNFEAFFELRAN